MHIKLIIYRGKGYLAFIIPIMCLAIWNYIFIWDIWLAFALILMPSSYLDYNIYLPLLISSFICFFLGRKLDSAGKGRIVYDPRTSQEQLVKSYDKFFSISLKNWGLIYGVLSLLTYILSRFMAA